MNPAITAPPMTEQPPVPLASPPPPATAATPTIRELVSQNAGKIPTEAALNAAIQQYFPNATPADRQVATQVWQDTRSGQGLPTGDSPAPPPQPQAQTGTPGAAATTGAPPPAVTTPPPPAATTSGAAAPGTAKPDPNAYPTYTSPTPTAAYKAPELLTPTYTAPTYKPPAKGLEYIAAGLSLLFPGAPIGRAAAGFAMGLNQGAENRYKREEEAAKTKYETERDKDQTVNQQRLAQAQADLELGRSRDAAAQHAYDAGYQARREAFQFQQAQRQQRISLGQDPNTGKPIPIPAALQRILPPGAKRAPTYDDYANHERALAKFYADNGATVPQHEHDLAAQDYARQAIDAANNARALGVASAQIQSRLSAAAMSAQSRITAAGIRAANEISGSERMTYRQTADRYLGQLRTNWNRDFYLSPGKDALGNPQPPPLAGQQAALSTVMRMIQKSNDPYGAATWAAQWYADPRIQDLLTTAGQGFEAQRKAAGQGIGEFAPPNIPGLNEQVKSRLSHLGLGVQQMVYSELLGGKSMPQIETEIAGSANPNKQVILDALAGKTHHEATPAPAHHDTFNPAAAVHGTMPNATQGLVQMP